MSEYFTGSKIGERSLSGIARWTQWYILLALIAYAMIYVVVIPRMSWDPDKIDLAERLLVLGMGLEFILFFMLRLGLVKSASWIQFIIVYGTGIIAFKEFGGLRGPVVALFFIFAPVSIAFFSERAAIFVSLASLGALVAGYLLEKSGLVKSYVSESGIEMLIVPLILLAISCIQVFFTVKEVRMERDESTNLSTKLQQKNVELERKKTELEMSRQELEKRVRERTRELATLNSSLKNQADELRDAKDKAVEADKLKSAFLASMSHEIRTPLTSIIGTADVLREDVGEVNRDLVELIYNGGQRLMSTLNSVLDLAQLEGRAREIKLERFDVFRRTKGTVSIFSKRAEQKRLKLIVSSEGESPFDCDLDKAAYDRIIQNLVGNSLKFTRKGEVKVIINGIDDLIEIRVIDSGIGMGSDYLPRLFDRFTQDSNGESRNFHGSGLGLAITKNLVEMMDGTISAESTLGKGSIFTVRFPRAKKNEAPKLDLADNDFSYVDRGN